jgi:hypothetical protein
MRNHRHLSLTQILIGTFIVLACACATADRQTGSVTAPKNASAVWTSVPELPTAPIILSRATFASLTESERTAVRATQDEAAWVGRLHNALLADVYEARGNRWGLSTDETRNADCRIAYQAMVRHLPEVRNRVGGSLDGSDGRTTVLDIINHMRMCQRISVLSIWGRPTFAGFGAIPDSLVSDLGYSYGEVVHQAVLATDGYPSSVHAAVNDVLAEATNAGLRPADLEYIAGVGSVADSSSVYWTGVQSGGGVIPNIQPMSIFGRKRNNPAIIGIVAVDVVGCLIGAASAWGGGERRARHLWGQCGLWGFGGSLAALLMM